MNESRKNLNKKQKRIQKQYIRQKVWEEMDDLEQKLYGGSEDSVGKKNEQTKKSTYKKPDKERKINEIKAYQDALALHRKNCSQFVDPFQQEEIKLNIEVDKTIKAMEEARQYEKDVASALRSIGLKRVKILFKCGANEHFESVINYLRRRKVPQWMKVKHEELLNKQY